ncbi:prolipoprotein diacylglyceryl transferase [Candidatus Parabeggiatoa sp. HSG14]|uniref:prolipoprotein diacylglyceryl transferase n=1 Tax=Candidatus Parabeggiatoa sp. HSG14 TaxID=3055593 RepID=UPI0025A6D4BE|nr:prolipoprotein diacylglyceryl transferase [Thiotrichales bacterium HSG14]
MLIYPEIDPIAFQLGPLKVHWYGIMYLIGFSLAWILGAKRAKHPNAVITKDQVSDLIFYGALGVVLGGRLGYILFYNLPTYINTPLTIFKVWQGGMSFHGGLIGVLVAMWLYAHKINRRFFEITDFIAPLIPLGLMMGRIGNFINGELWGRPTDLPWGMIFPHAGDSIVRHPSQLYQAALEGVVLFIILWLFSKRPRPIMAVSGLFLMGYGIFRFLAEFARTPDAHLGFIAFDWMTMGQILTLPMLIIGGLLMGLAYFAKEE